MSAGMRNTLFVDLDNTLHDYDLASKLAREDLACRFAEASGVSAAEIISVYNELLGGEKNGVAESGMAARRARLQKLAKNLKIEIDIEWALKAFSERLLTSVHPYPGAIRTLRILKRQYRIVILSEGYRDVQCAICERLGLDPSTWEIFASYEKGTRKRDGTAFVAALAQYELHASEVIVIGDNWDWDILASSKVGLWQIWISKGRESPIPAPLKFVGAVNQFCEVPRLLTPTVPNE